MENKAKGFTYVKTPYNYISYYKDGTWDEGALRTDDKLTISATSTALHYGQQAFEGLKAYRRKDGKINLFRVMDNAKRFQDSCAQMLMPKLPLDVFVDAVKKVVLANESSVPDYGTGATLYIRPFMIGVGDNLGLKPAPEYIFSIVCSPVSSYFSGPLKPLNLVTSIYDRAAPMGTGQAKVGGNYGASFYAKKLGKDEGFDDIIFLDPKTHTKIDEVGAANFVAVTKNHIFITPKSPSILNSITNRSLRYLARHILNLDVEETEIHIDKLDHIREAGACGTAAVLSPIGSITHEGHKHVFTCHKVMGETLQKLYDLLIGIQYGDIDDPSDWVTVLDPKQ